MEFSAFVWSSLQFKGKRQILLRGLLFVIIMLMPKLFSLKLFILCIYQKIYAYQDKHTKFYWYDKVVFINTGI